MAKIEITSAGIKKNLETYNYLKAIAEYVWNGFDAGATRIMIETETDNRRYISVFKVIDNGVGINRDSLDLNFKPFSKRESVQSSEQVRNPFTHGKNGVGRLTFFTFALEAVWKTVYEVNGTKYKYSVKIDSKNLDDYSVLSSPTETQETTGTTVSFTGIHTIYPKTTETKINDFLLREFAWFLELNKSKEYSISVNNVPLDYKDLIGEQSELKDINYDFKLNYIRWKERLNDESSKFYLIDSKGNAVHSETTGFNNKGDGFFHSVFITGSLFDEFQGISSSALGTESSQCYKKLIHDIKKALRKKQREYLNVYINQVVKNFEKDGVFPSFGKNEWDKIRETELKSLVGKLYQVEPKIFSDLSVDQKKIFVYFLNMIMDSNERDNLLDVIKNIIGLDSSELEQLSSILKTSRLSNIIKAVNLIEDRYKAIEQLKELVYKEELKANERDHLQKFIEAHYWIFGEKYHLVTADKKFEEALRKYTHLLKGENKKVTIDHPDKNREMDIFMVRQLPEENLIHNAVVELKHPKIMLGEEELTQVKTYMRVIRKQAEFNASNMLWSFYLVGNRFGDDIQEEIENSRYHGEKSLVHSVDNHKIYVKTWSEIFAEFELRHNFILEKLKLEREALVATSSNTSEIMEGLEQNTAVQASPLRVPNAV